MNNSHLSSWEEVLNSVPMSDSQLPIGTQSPSACDAWRARIETTLLADLSEEERSSLAEHVKSCSACAERFRQYEIIEEFAGELPYYELLDHSCYSAFQRPQRQPERRWNIINRGLKRLVLVLCIAVVTHTVIATAASSLVASPRRSRQTRGDNGYRLLMYSPQMVAQPRRIKRFTVIASTRKGGIPEVAPLWFRRYWHASHAPRSELDDNLIWPNFI